MPPSPPHPPRRTLQPWISRRPRSLKAHQPGPGGSEVFPEAGLSSSTGRARSWVAAGLPRIVFQVPPTVGRCKQPFPAQGPEKTHHGSGIRQVESHSPWVAQPIWQLIPARNECPVSQSPQKTPKQAEFCSSSSPGSQLRCLPQFPLLPIRRRLNNDFQN